MSKSKLRISVVVILAVLLIISGVGTVFFYTEYKKLAGNNPAYELSTITQRLSRFMDLPQEDPSLVTIADTEKISDQGLRLKAAVGDKLILYPQAKRALLYRPSSNRLIDVFLLDLSNAVIASEEEDEG